jgi:GMP synthase-like glutamine amidotransferase
LGCQLIAQTYGCKIKKLKKVQIGYNLLDIRTLKKKEIKNDKYLSKINYKELKGAFSLHNDYIEINKNSDIKLICSSTNDLPYIIKHKNKKIYGFQQHPEHTKKSLKKIIKMFKIDANENDVNDDINVNFFDCFMN